MLLFVSLSCSQPFCQMIIPKVQRDLEARKPWNLEEKQTFLCWRFSKIESGSIDKMHMWHGNLNQFANTQVDVYHGFVVDRCHRLATHLRNQKNQTMSFMDL
ncbi:hypothetical protein CRM22_009651 [Opisthorchis felineus]|uniref:Uncharacterized protein n=1 Tax=Opisthorchis felineus TaxID=147828 RepID=A0A4S2LD25_OPIFE|nr:hypothetical protein CRM22_009651 [Opisthorchis felineus]